MLEQPDFIHARFHTAYLDQVLRSRAGQPFTSVDDERIEVAAIAAAIVQVGLFCRVRKDPASTTESQPSAWKARARTEGLRD